MNKTPPVARAVLGKLSITIAIAAIVLLCGFIFLVLRADLSPETWLGDVLNRYGETLIIVIAIAHVAGLLLALIALVVEGGRRGWGWAGLLLNGAVLAFLGFSYFAVYELASGI